MMETRTLRVAMLEDDSDDHYLTNEMITELRFGLELSFYRNSGELLSAISQRLPNLVLLDDDSIPENGLQVLRHIKQDEKLSQLPVVVLSDSRVAQHREAYYREGACSFVIKPASLEETKKKIKSFFTYWLEVAEC